MLHLLKVKFLTLKLWYILLITSFAHLKVCIITKNTVYLECLLPSSCEPHSSYEMARKAHSDHESATARATSHSPSSTRGVSGL